MINIDFSPNSIQSLIDSNSEILSNVDDLERLSLPEHEDIERELTKSKKEIDNHASEIKKSGENIKNEASSILDKDFEYKFLLFTQLIIQGLTEESFPILEWIEEKQKLDEYFTQNHFIELNNQIKNIQNQEIKEVAINEYYFLIRGCLNSQASFKYNNGSALVVALNEFVDKYTLNKEHTVEVLKNYHYSKETGSFKNYSQANFWQIYTKLKEIENNPEEAIKMISSIKENQIKEFVVFLTKTDYFIKRNYRNSIEGFKKEPLRNLMGLLEDKEIRENFFPEFIHNLKEIKEINYLKKEDIGMFNLVMEELDKANQYLTLMKKLDKNLEKTKPIKI